MSKDNKDFHFDKFMKDIVEREEVTKDQREKLTEKHVDNPRRIYNRLYRERWQNRIKWGRR